MNLKKIKIPLHWQILGGMIAGLIWGIIAVNSGYGQFTSDYLKPFGTIFVNLLKMIAIPMIITSLIVGISSLSDIKKLSRIGGKSIGIFLLTTVMAISIGVAMVNIFKPGEGIPEETKQQLMAAYADKAGSSTEKAADFKERPPLQTLIDLFPENLISAATDNKNMLQIVLVVILAGIALILVPADKTEPVKKLFEGLNEIILKMVDIIMYMAPIGVFGLMSAVITEVAGDDPAKAISILSALGRYGLVLIVALILHMLLVYIPIVKFVAKLNPITFLKKMRPVQLLAFSTSSSNATLPLNIENSTERMGLSKDVAGFTLPLGATVNMDGTSMYQAVAAVFIAQVFNMDLTFSDQLIIIVTATLASIGSAGVPGAGMIMLVIVLNAVHVPAEGIALILGPDRILDMCRTVVNVTGDAAVTAAVARGEYAIDEEVFNG
ncbi:MAG: dicarboxylate/amino acid:cation symporter [Flavobacteriales bacterium]|nr:dicarboxylate/amino acid:cation symporter [Flavobacteriales bacterium]